MQTAHGCLELGLGAEHRTREIREGAQHPSALACTTAACRPTRGCYKPGHWQRFGRPGGLNVMCLIDFSQFVNELATLSGRAILPFFRSSIAAEDKSRGGAFDPVTEADRAGEAAMRQLIKRTFPTHGIVGEEFGSERTDAEYVWVLDPIDGTRAFISGLP